MYFCVILRREKEIKRQGCSSFSSLNLALWFTHHLVRILIPVVVCFFHFVNMQGAQGVQGYPGENGPQGPPGTSVSMNLCPTCYFNLFIFKVTKRITWLSQTSLMFRNMDMWNPYLSTPICFFLFLLIIYYAWSFTCFQKLHFHFQIITHKFTLNTNVNNYNKVYVCNQTI